MGKLPKIKREKEELRPTTWNQKSMQVIHFKKIMKTIVIIKVLNPMIIVFISFFTLFTFCRSVIHRLQDSCQDKNFRVLEKISYHTLTFLLGSPAG